MKKYIVICVYDRVIVDVGSADSMEKAVEIMKADFMEVFLDFYNADELEDGMGIDWDIDEFSAWINTNHSEYDWKVIEI